MPRHHKLWSITGLKSLKVTVLPLENCCLKPMRRLDKTSMLSIHGTTVNHVNHNANAAKSAGGGKKTT